MPSVIVICKLCDRRLQIARAESGSNRESAKASDPNALRFAWVTDDNIRVPSVWCPEHGELGPPKRVVAGLERWHGDPTLRVTVRLRPVR